MELLLFFATVAWWAGRCSASWGMIRFVLGGKIIFGRFRVIIVQENKAFGRQSLLCFRWILWRRASDLVQWYACSNRLIGLAARVRFTFRAPTEKKCIEMTNSRRQKHQGHYVYSRSKDAGNRRCHQEEEQRCLLFPCELWQRFGCCLRSLLLVDGMEWKRSA